MDKLMKLRAYFHSREGRSWISLFFLLFLGISSIVSAVTVKGVLYAMLAVFYFTLAALRIYAMISERRLRGQPPERIEKYELKTEHVCGWVILAITLPLALSMIYAIYFTVSGEFATGFAVIGYTIGAVYKIKGGFQGRKRTLKEGSRYEVTVMQISAVVALYTIFALLVTLLVAFPILAHDAALLLKLIALVVVEILIARIAISMIRAK